MKSELSSFLSFIMTNIKVGGRDDESAWCWEDKQEAVAEIWQDLDDDEEDVRRGLVEDFIEMACDDYHEQVIWIDRND